ncbi:RNA polymerase sigma factor RpoD/SigA [uncultured Abiotrophia sp.]|uniref:sigma-70 family RNA polymerase sigma factor n=1 Tax=uncultured Abiotrophia sp. TaxID=316094 RepID=UPI0028894740|nr:RNA polymerase sigma factor RpoD/SigA [uncultured Abiotrophia sp.]
MHMNSSNMVNRKKNPVFEAYLLAEKKGELKDQHSIKSELVIVEDMEDNGDDDYLDIDALLSLPEFEDLKSVHIETLDFRGNLIMLEEYSLKKDPVTLNRLVEANERLVRKIANHYRKLATADFDFEDMMQYGRIGLIKAAKKFNLSYGTQFSTYAFHWIMQSITRGIADDSTLIRLPVHVREKILKIIKKVREQEFEKGEVNTKEIAQQLDMTEQEVARLLYYKDMFWNLASLDSPVGESDGDTTLGEFVADKQASVEGEILHGDLSDQIDKLLSELSDKEREIILYRFGFHDGRTYTLEEVGKIYGVTRERIRQIEVKALRKLQRRARYNPKLKEYIEDYVDWEN